MMSRQETVDVARPGATPDGFGITLLRDLGCTAPDGDLATLVLAGPGTRDTTIPPVSIERLDQPDREGIVAWSWVTWAASAPLSDTTLVG